MSETQRLNGKQKLVEVVTKLSMIKSTLNRFRIRKAFWYDSLLRCFRRAHRNYKVKMDQV